MNKAEMLELLTELKSELKPTVSGPARLFLQCRVPALIDRVANLEFQLAEANERNGITINGTTYYGTLAKAAVADLEARATAAEQERDRAEALNNAFRAVIALELDSRGITITGPIIPECVPEYARQISDAERADLAKISDIIGEHDHADYEYAGGTVQAIRNMADDMEMLRQRALDAEQERDELRKERSLLARRLAVQIDLAASVMQKNDALEAALQKAAKHSANLDSKLVAVGKERDELLKELAEQNYACNRKTNNLIERHAEQIVELKRQQDATTRECVRYAQERDDLRRQVEGLREAARRVVSLVGWTLGLPEIPDAPRIHKNAGKEAAEAVRDLHTALAALPTAEPAKEDGDA